MTICYAFFHGLQSSPSSRKAQVLSSWFSREQQRLHRPDLRQPSLEKLTITAALAEIDTLHERVQAGDPGSIKWRIIGSSFGAYLAALWAEINPDKIDRLLLLNPALDRSKLWKRFIGESALEKWEQAGEISITNAEGQATKLHYALLEDAQNYPDLPQVPCPTRIVHGREDEVVPIELSRDYARSVGQVTLIEVEDDHRLAASMPQIVSQARHLMAPDFDKIPADDIGSPDCIFHWDFFGPTAKGTAEHFLHHLEEFIAQRGIQLCETGLDSADRTHWAAWCRTAAHQRSIFEKTLRPQRTLCPVPG